MKDSCFYSFISILILFLFSVDAVAQRHVRKGFVLGLGLGAGITSTKYVDSPVKVKSIGSLVTDFKIGGAPTDQIAVYWTGKTAYFNNSNQGSSSLTISGFGGVGISYFLNPVSPSIFFTGLVGYSNWAKLDDAQNHFSFGYGGGVGYEFARHFIAELNLTFGSPDISFYQTKVVSPRLTISWLLY